MLGRLIHRPARRLLPLWLTWRITNWRSWGREWPQTDFDWYNYALAGVPRLRREITLRHWAGEEDAEIAGRFGLSQNEVLWHYAMTSGHIEAVFEGKKRREEDRKYLAFVNQDYPEGQARMPRTATKMRLRNLLRRAAP